ncbi:MAG: hypothetical protein ACHQD7_00825 [Chitinophagales bacterium]
MKMAAKKISALYTGFLILITLAIITLALVVRFIGYDQLVVWIVHQINKPETASLLRNQAFTFQKFRLLQKISFLALFLFPLIAFLLYAFRYAILKRIRFILESIHKEIKVPPAIYREHSRKERIIFFSLLFLIMLKSLYYLITRDLQYDEMWSYNYFTAPPFYFPLFMYNNYPLYEMATHLFKWLPFPAKINIRLPVLIMGLLSVTLLYSCLYRYFKKSLPAVAGVILFAFMPPATTYMVYGRGIMFELFFAILALFSLLQWLRDTKQTGKLVIFIIANISGIYSMPTHGYLTVCLFVFALFFKKSDHIAIRKLIIACLLIAAGSVLCYLPVLIGSGFSFVTHIINGTGRQDNLIWDVIPIMNRTSYFITGFVQGLPYLIIICLILLLFRKHFKPFASLILFCIMICLMPAVQFLIQRLFIPERALAFICLAPPLMAAVLFYNFDMVISRTVSYSFLLLTAFTAAGISHRNGSLNWSKKLDGQVKELSQVFLVNGITTCYDNSAGSVFFYFYPGIEFYYRQAGKTIRLTVNDTRSLRFKPFSANDPYDAVVSYKDSSRFLPYPHRIIYSSPEESFEVLKLR